MRGNSLVSAELSRMEAFVVFHSGSVAVLSATIHCTKSINRLQTPLCASADSHYSALAPPYSTVSPRALELGKLKVWPPVVLAPMAGITSYPFRSLCREYGAGL
mmetsp:Transcript_9718/g.17536  ORF Transcript_9718/g.17536 Transcript_9718/m.17536 type:complete len:104 (+) Transcript_9718:45-356(+)